MISFVLTLKRLFSAVLRVGKEPIFKTLLLTLALILLSGTLFYHQTEGWSLLDSFYFAFVSLVPTGVNTGLTPEATSSKWFTMFYLVGGVGVMLMLLMKLGLAIIKFEKPGDKAVQPKK